MKMKNIILISLILILLVCLVLNNNTELFNSNSNNSVKKYINANCHDSDYKFTYKYMQ